MIRMNIDGRNGQPLKILCIGCHSDDIEIGCGGTLLRLAEQFEGCEFHWAVFSAPGIRKDEAEHAASLFAGANLKSMTLKTFRDGFMPFEGALVKDVFENELKSCNPDIVFTQNRRDAHQDHRLISELTWNTFRDHCIFEYEIPKYDGDLGQPSVFVSLKQDICERKVKYLLESFGSQRSKRWFEESTFMSLMRLRGMECNSDSGYAEAFYSRKIVL
jgi:LmbE family N-acetylglucosaminyl deacetylase